MWMSLDLKTWTHLESQSQLTLEVINTVYATISILGCVSKSLFVICKFSNQSQSEGELVKCTIIKAPDFFFF